MTQILDRRHEHLSNDVAFAVWYTVIVDFIAKEEDENAKFELRLNFKIATLEQAELKVNAVKLQRRGVYRLIEVRKSKRRDVDMSKC